MNEKKTKTEKGLTEEGTDERRRRPDCAAINAIQNAVLSRRCANKVNRLSCRCSGCETDDRDPVILSPADAPLLNTAFDGSGGFLSNSTSTSPVRDLNWEVGLGNSTGGPASVSTWIPAYVFGPSPTFTPWIPSPFSNANWISHFVDANQQNAGFGDVDAYFRYRFNLGSSVNPATFAVDMDFFADNQVAEIYINGVPQSTLPNGSGVLPQQGFPPATGGPYSTSGFGKKSGVHIRLDNSWRRCQNEIVVYVRSSPRWLGFLAQNSVEVKWDDNPCDCHCDCSEIKFPDVHPCISVAWGDSPCDCLETDDVEVACITVCNCYSSVTFNDLSIGQISVTDLAGNPVPNLPDGTPSIQIIPSGPICFGDILPCQDRDHPSCVSRELVIYTRGAIGQKYRLVFNGICFSVCHQFQSEQCFIMELCRD